MPKQIDEVRFRSCYSGERLDGRAPGLGGTDEERRRGWYGQAPMDLNGPSGIPANVNIARLGLMGGMMGGMGDDVSTPSNGPLHKKIPSGPRHGSPSSEGFASCGSPRNYRAR